MSLEPDVEQDPARQLEMWAQAGVDLLIRFFATVVGLAVHPRLTLGELGGDEAHGRRYITAGIFGTASTLLLGLTFPSLSTLGFAESSLVLRSIFQDAGVDASVLAGMAMAAVSGHAVVRWAARWLGDGDDERETRLGAVLTYVASMQVFGFTLFATAFVALWSVAHVSPISHDGPVELAVLVPVALLVTLRPFLATRGWLQSTDARADRHVLGALVVVLLAPAVAVGVGFAVFSAVEQVEPLPDTVAVHPLGSVELSDRVVVHVLVGNRSDAPLFVGRTDVELGVRLGSVRRPVSDVVVVGDAWTRIEPGETGVLRVEGPIPEELAAVRATCSECTAGLQIQVRLSGDQGAHEHEAGFKGVPWTQGVQDSDSVPSISSE